MHLHALFSKKKKKGKTAVVIWEQDFLETATIMANTEPIKKNGHAHSVAHTWPRPPSKNAKQESMAMAPNLALQQNSSWVYPFDNSTISN